MNRLALIVFALVLVIARPAFAQSFYKCTNPDGSVSYQDRACPDSASEKRVSTGQRARAPRVEDSLKIIPVPGVGEAGVLVFDYMQHIVRQDGSHGTTVGIRSKPGTRDKMSMMMTFMPNPGGVATSRQEQEAVARQLAAQELGFGNFPAGRMQNFNAKSGTGVYTSINHPDYPRGRAPDGEYATITGGQIVDSNVIVDITILSDGVDNRGFRDAIRIAESFIAAPAIVAVGEDGESRMPDPPAGFTWQQAPEIKGVFLRPDGWHFDKQTNGGSLAYFISREPNTPPDGFDTGLTINVNKDVPAKTGMMPSQYAEAYIESGATEFDVIGETFSNSRGTYVVHGGLFRVTDPVKGDFNAHMIAMANDATGTVYFMIFEGPAENWDATWQIGETILRNIALNESI